jgi:hypothetical protein
MGGKPRAKPIHVITEPRIQTIDLCTEKELFAELERRGYALREYPGRQKTSMMFMRGEITPLENVLLMVPKGKWPKDGTETV